MAFAIIWSKQALDDLRGIVVFIARDNPDAAAQFGYRLISKVDLLSEFPAMGRVVPEQKSTDVRELILRPYRIIYEVRDKENAVAIARVWHGARGKPGLHQSEI
jgi:toxin ParE1/3/4